MKPFDLEKALAGAPCISRSGHEARVVFYDPCEKNSKPVLVVIKSMLLEGAWTSEWISEEGRYADTGSSLGDIFMAGDTKSEEEIDLSTAKHNDKFKLENGTTVVFLSKEHLSGQYVCRDNWNYHLCYTKEGKFLASTGRKYQLDIAKKINPAPPKPEIDLSSAKYGDLFETRGGDILVFMRKGADGTNILRNINEGKSSSTPTPYTMKIVKKISPSMLDSLPKKIYGTPRSALNPCSGCGIYPQRFTVTLGAMFFQCNSCMKSGYPHLQYEDAIQSWNALNPILTEGK